MILTDKEMRDLEKLFHAERVRTSDEEYLIIYPGEYGDWQRAIEAAILSKLNSADPVAFISGFGCQPNGDLNCKAWSCGNYTTPLFTHPPAPSVVNVSLTDEGKTNQLADFIHRFKRHVGGDGEFWLHELEDFYLGDVAAKGVEK